MAYGISGGHIEGFREGWAILPFNHKPHYWKRKELSLVFTAECGFEIDQTRYHPGAQRQFAPGVFMVDRCKVCSRYHKRDAFNGSSASEGQS